MNPRPPGPRRAAVELRFNAATTSALPSVAGRALHQYWSLLVPHFRGIFLAPQWRADSTGLNWSWREPGPNAPLSTAELATVRKRLASAQRSLADTAEDAPPADPRHAVVSLAQIQSCTGELVATLSALPDPTLAAYVARTEQGPMLHSWGLSPALTPFYPDTANLEIGGTVFIAGHPAPDHEVVLANAEGKSFTRTRTDTDGRFRFLKLFPGPHRVRVISTTTTFPPEGVALELQRTAVTDLELHDLAHHPSHATSAASTSGPRRLYIALSIAALLITLATLWWWRSHPATARATANRTPPSINPAALTQTSSGELASASPTAQPGSASAHLFPHPELSAAPPARTAFSHLVDVPRSSSSGPSTPSPAGAPPPSGSATVPSATSQSASSSLTNATPTPNPSASPLAPPAGATTSSSHPSASTDHSATSDRPSIAHTSTPTKSPPVPVAPKPTPTPTLAPPPQENPPSPPEIVPTVAATPSTPKTPRKASPDPTATDDLIKDPAPTDVSAVHPASPLLVEDPAAPPVTEAALTDAPSSPRSHRAQARPESPTPAENDLAATTTATALTANPTATSFAAPPRLLRFHLTRWQPRLLRDAILPTLPTRRSEVESIDALRTRLFRERQQQLPPTFQSPVTQLGFALELPADHSASPTQWSDTRGATPSAATINGTRAEFSWSDAQPPHASTSYTLHTTTGRLLARVDFDANREATLTTTAEIRAWPWLALTPTPTAAPPLDLDWQVLSGPAAPVTWQPRAEADRLDLIPSPEETGRHQRTLALLDRTTGWALVCELTTASESPEISASTH